MVDLRNKAKELLAGGTVKVVIGYGEGSDGKAKAIFARKPEDCDRLIFDARCQQNIAVYVHKHEVKHLGKAAIVATDKVLKSLVILANERQFRNGDIIALAITPENKILELSDFVEIGNYLKQNSAPITDAERQLLQKIDSMTSQQRAEYWQSEFDKCIKCYACRSACSLCYCTKCTVEANQPQWISVPAHSLGNLEWHVMRAMHLAGRCANCGECARACPVDIPLNLIMYKLIDVMLDNFGTTAGYDPEATFALSTFKTNDKESFIV